MQALIFTAGRGERLRPHTDILAKPAIPFLNVPILGYSLFYLQKAGLQQITLNTHHLPATIERVAKQLAGPQTQIAFSKEQSEILGSGGGLAQAVKTASTQVADDLVLANGDMVALYHNSQIVQQLMKTHRESSALATLLLCPFPTAQESFGGVYIDDAHQVKRFSKTALSQPGLSPWHFTGLMVVHREVWQGLACTPSNIFYDVLQKKIDQGAKVKALTLPPTTWFETGNSQDYLKATESALKILATPGLEQQILIQILDRYTPGWWKGWRLPKNNDGYLLCTLPWPDRVRVTGFAVVGPLDFASQHIHFERCVVAGPAHFPEHTHIKDNLMIFPEEGP